MSGVRRCHWAPVLAAMTAIAIASGPAPATAAPTPSPSPAGPASPAATPTLPAATLTATMTPAKGAPGSVIRISGTLTDSHRKPVDAASIAVGGSFDDVPRAYTASDAKGVFNAALQVPPGTPAGSYTIQASLVGDTRFRAVSQSWRFEVVAAPGATPSSPGTDSSSAAGGATQPGASSSAPDSSDPELQSAEPQSTEPHDTGATVPQAAGSVLPAGDQSDRPSPPGLLAALGGRTAVLTFVVVVACLLVLAGIGWIIRAVARWIHRRRHPEDADQGPEDGANDLFG